MIKLLHKILDILFPQHTTCVICGEELNHNDDCEICDRCQKLLPYKKGKTCARCGTQISSMATVCNRCQNRQSTFKYAISPFAYKDSIKNLIYDLKYNNKKYVAKTLSYYMANCYKQHNFNCDLIIPVPIHKDRQRKRGYNQSELLSKHLSKFINLPTNSSSLIRVKNTITQTNLTYQERQENLKQAFKVVDKKAIKNKTILLVDDVFTTGATAISCTKELKKYGAKDVYVLSVAHTIIE